MSKIVETEVFTFEELDEKAKERARNWYRDINSEYYWLTDAMTEYALDLLIDAKIKTENFKVYCSLSYSQGDGAMVELKGTWKGYYVEVKQYGHYYHEQSTQISIESTKTGNSVSDKVLKDFEENVYIPLCLQLKKYGYDWIAHENSNEVIDENIINTEYTFTKEGKRF